MQTGALAPLLPAVAPELLYPVSAADSHVAAPKTQPQPVVEGWT